MIRREPQPIVLPQVKSKNVVVSRLRVVDRVVRRARSCGSGCQFVAEPGDRFCGECGEPLVWRL